MTGDVVENLVVDAGITALAGVRRTVLRICREAGLPIDLCDTAVLLASEMTTNAIRYAPVPVGVSITAWPGGVRIEVADDSDSPPVTRGNDPQATGGRGMTIIDALATAWGIENRKTGKTVWFELSLGDRRGLA